MSTYVIPQGQAKAFQFMSNIADAIRARSGNAAADAFMNDVVNNWQQLMSDTEAAIDAGTLSTNIKVAEKGGEIVQAPGQPGIVSLSNALLSGNQATLENVLAHEVGHANNPNFLPQFNAWVSNVTRAIGGGGATSNITSLVSTFIDFSTQNEAYAEISEWNDYISSYMSKNPGKDYSVSQDGRPVGQGLIDAIQGWTANSIIVTDSGGLLPGLSFSGSAQISNSQANVSALAQGNKSETPTTGQYVNYQQIDTIKALGIVTAAIQQYNSSTTGSQISNSVGISFSGVGLNSDPVSVANEMVANNMIVATHNAQPFIFEDTDTGNKIEVVTIVQTDKITQNYYVKNTNDPNYNNLTVTGSPVKTITFDPATYQANASAAADIAHLEYDGLTTLSDTGKIYESYGSAIGSTLGDFLSNGNKVNGIVYSTLLGQIGKGLALSIDGVSSDLTKFLDNTNRNVLDNFDEGLGAGLLSQGLGAISSTLALDLANDLGVRGFGADLLSTVASADTSAVVVQVLNNIKNSVDLFTGFNGAAFKTISPTEQIVKPTAPTTSLTTVAESAISSFVAAKLASALVSPNTQAAVYLSQLGSSLGAIGAFSSTVGLLGGVGLLSSEVTTTLAIGVYDTGLALGVVGAAGSETAAWTAVSQISNIIAPGIGTFIGFVLGALIGNLFGHKKPQLPSAGAETILQLPYAQYSVGNITSSNGGSTDVVMQMAQTAAGTLNGLISQVTRGGGAHFVANGASPTQAYGYSGSQIYVKYGGAQYNYSSADQAVSAGVLWALPQTQIIGGDLFVKRAIKNSVAADLTSFLGDIQTAQDYEYYVSHVGIINSYVSAAYNTLSSDEQNFYTTYKTLVDQVEVGGVSSLNASDLNFYNGSTNGILNSRIIGDIVSAIQSQSIANPWIVTLERVDALGLNNWSASDFYGGLQGFLQSFGMGQVDSTAHYEDIRLGWDGVNLTITDAGDGGLFSALDQASADGTSVIINNFNSVMGGSAAIGSDILFGTDNGGTLAASAVDTWIQGGANQALQGGTGHDVLIGGAGTVTIRAGDGGYYLNDTTGSYLAGAPAMTPSMAA